MLRAVVVLLLLARVAAAEPSGAHPRLILDDELRATWKRQAGERGSSVAQAVAHCDEVRGAPKEFDRDGYMGLDFAHHLHACLIAYAATGKDGYAKTALVYFKANLYDLEALGDGKGGDEAARRDAGYAMRAMGPSTALAYDWLHDHPDMTDKLRATARQRFKAWTDWYAESGYRARSPGSNYHAGYLIAATFIAIAQAGEAGKDSTALWDHVATHLWGEDMTRALEPGGVLDGGDWAEGWQYAPLAVASYALAAREIARQGVTVAGIDTWLESVVKHNVYARSPGGGVYVNGDTQETTANLPPRYLAYVTPLVGEASAQTWGWAKAELATKIPHDDDFPLFGAVAEAREVDAIEVPRAEWPTSYLSRGTGTFYARTHWDDDAVWMVTTCTRSIDTDHFHMDSGNVVVSRGGDDVIVDPSPYGSLSSLTSNAPTVRSAQLPEDYQPSQAGWSQATRYVWARQTTSGVVATRCDYADQYRFQEEPSDVPAATRDLVMIPYDGGASAAVVVVDLAESGDRGRPLHLRFRTPGKLAQNGDVITGRVGKTELTIHRVSATGGKGEVRHVPAGDCWGEQTTRGGCDAPRFDVDEARLVVPGPEMRAIHVIDVGAAAAGDAVALAGADGVTLTRGGATTTVALAHGKELTYTAPAGTHVVLAPAESGGRASISARSSSGGCEVTVRAGGDGVAVDARPAVFAVATDCAITEDPTLPGGPTLGDGGVGIGTGTGLGTGTGSGPRTPRTGCCGASASPGSPLAMAGVVLVGLLGLLRRRRRR